MKRCVPTILFFFVFIACGCENSYEQLKEIDPKSYNQKILSGVEADYQWAKSPQNIAKQLFPRDAHTEGKNSYIVTEEHSSESHQKITVVEEGVFDDELMGEKAILDFEFKNKKWEISKLCVSFKRRS